MLQKLDSPIVPYSSLSCDTCHHTKQKHPSFLISNFGTKNIFDLIYLDIWDLFSFASLYGHYYFLTIVDDQSRYI